MLWLTVGGADVIKININIEDELIVSLIPAFKNFVRFQLVLSGAKKIPPNWDDIIRKKLFGRKFPLAIEFANRKLTFVIDGGEQIDSSGIGGPIVVSVLSPNVRTDSGKGLSDI